MGFAGVPGMAKTRKRESAIAPAERGRTSATSVPTETSPRAAGDTTATASGRDRVALRAYELNQARGRGEGRELDDWLTAEQEHNARKDDPARE
jgi:hypothetical protein